MRTLSRLQPNHPFSFQEKGQGDEFDVSKQFARGRQ